MTQEIKIDLKIHKCESLGEFSYSVKIGHSFPDIPWTITILSYAVVTFIHAQSQIHLVKTTESQFLNIITALL